jgi:hypothetical protein
MLSPPRVWKVGLRCGGLESDLDRRPRASRDPLSVIETSRGRKRPRALK